LPNNIFARIVKLIFNDDEFATFIKGEEIKTLIRVGELAIKLFLDYQVFLAENLRIIRNPLLQIITLGQF
jgi:hypothetical protein